MDISIISINYNSSDLTLGLVKSIIQQISSSVLYEIIIIDNCSKPEDYLNLKRVLGNYDSRVTIVRSNINLGFGGGNMLGTQYASGKYLAFVNNDIIFIEDCFSSLKKFMETHQSIAVVTPQQLDRHEKPTYSFDYFHGIRKEIFGRKAIELTSKKIKRERKQYTDSFSVDFVQGSFMFFDAHKFAEVGGFDTNIFLYYEEMDICYRLQQKGYASYLHPETAFIHLQGESTTYSYEIAKELKLSKLYVFRKNHHYLKYLIIRFYWMAVCLYKSIFKPVFWELFFITITGKYVENSLKLQQKIVFIENE